MALLARQLYFEAVKVGDELPPLVKPPVDRVQIARFAGASFDFNPLSVDEHHARNSGFPAPHVPATLVMSFLAELAVDWLRGARIRRFSTRFVKIVFPGDVLTCRGRVVDRRFDPAGVYTVDIEVWAENQRGELATRGLVTAQLYYSAEDETRQRAGQSPLVVTPEQEAAALAKLSRAQTPKKADVPPPPAPPPPKPPPAGKVAPPKVAAPLKAPVPPARPPPVAAKSIAPAAQPQAARPAAAKPVAPAPKPPPLPPKAAPVPAKATPVAAKPPPPVPSAKPAAPVRPAAAVKPVMPAKSPTTLKPASVVKPAAAARPAPAAKAAAAPRPATTLKPGKPLAPRAPASARAAPKPSRMAARRPPHKVGKVHTAPQKTMTKVRDAVRKLKAAVRPVLKSKTGARSSRQRPGASKPSQKKRR